MEQHQVYMMVRLPSWKFSSYKKEKSKKVGLRVVSFVLISAFVSLALVALRSCIRYKLHYTILCVLGS